MRQLLKPLYIDDIKRIMKGNIDREEFKFTDYELMILESIFSQFESMIVSRNNSWDCLGVMQHLRYGDQECDKFKIIRYLESLGYEAGDGYHDESVRVGIQMSDITKKNNTLQIKLIQHDDTRIISVHDILDFGKYKDCSIKELLNSGLLERSYVCNFLHDNIGLKFDSSINIKSIKESVKSTNRLMCEFYSMPSGECLNG